MAKLSKKMKRDRKAIRRFNAYLDLDQMRKTFSDEDWNIFIGLLNDGRLTFSGDTTGFHLEYEGTWHSAARPKDVKRAYPEGLPGLKVMREAADTADLNWKNINAELEDVRAKLTEFLVIMTGIHEELVRKYPVAEKMVAESPSGKILGHFQRLFPGIQIQRTQFPAES